MTCEIKRRKKYCYEEGWIEMAKPYYFKDEK
jgi:hypothetical protein